MKNGFALFGDGFKLFKVCVCLFHVVSCSCCSNYFRTFQFATYCWLFSIVLGCVVSFCGYFFFLTLHSCSALFEVVFDGLKMSIVFCRFLVVLRLF